LTKEGENFYEKKKGPRRKKSENANALLTGGCSSGGGVVSTSWSNTEGNTDKNDDGNLNRKRGLEEEKSRGMD